MIASNVIPDIVEIECFGSMPDIVLSLKIYGLESNERLIAKAAELVYLNSVADTRWMPTTVRAYTHGMLPDVLAARRI